MTHLLVEQLRFARMKFVAGLEGVSAEDALKRLGPMNSIGWVVGHLAAFEQYTWLKLTEDRIVNEAVTACGFGKPASTPSLDAMLAAWHEITAASDPFLDSLDDEKLATTIVYQGKPVYESIGTMLLRHINHYWYHLGEVQAIRQMLNHENLPPYVGNIPVEYRFHL